MDTQDAAPRFVDDYLLSLLARASFVVSSEFHDRLRARGVSVPVWRVLATLSGGPETAGLARDTVFAAVMIILTGMVGLCLLIGGAHHREQTFVLHGVSASLATLAAIVVLTLVLPNYTLSSPGPGLTGGQLAFIAVVALILYGTFVFAQAIRHRDYFLPAVAPDDEAVHAEPPPNVRSADLLPRMWVHSA